MYGNGLVATSAHFPAIEIDVRRVRSTRETKGDIKLPTTGAPGQ